MKSITGIVVGLLVTLSIPLRAGDDFCGLLNHAFKSGESITYRVYYKVVGMYIAAG
jgi:hypothetical protein